jgi:hypothetical protein
MQMATDAGFLFASAAITGLLGSVHLLYTFRGPKLTPRDGDLRQRMEQVAPVLTRETTMWKAWIGFNASHSLGALLFAAVFGWLALEQPALAFGSTYVMALGAAFLLAWLWLARRYWFRIPFIGILLSLGCYAAAFSLARLHP